MMYDKNWEKIQDSHSFSLSLYVIRTATVTIIRWKRKKTYQPIWNGKQKISSIPYCYVDGNIDYTLLQKFCTTIEKLTISFDFDPVGCFFMFLQIDIPILIVFIHK